MLEVNAAQIVGGFIVCLVGVAAWSIREWKDHWENRVIAIDDRVEEHHERLAFQQVINQALTKDIEHIKVAVDETSSDVKELLKQNGNKRSTAR